MLSPLMIISTDQGNLKPAPRSLGPFDAHLLDDIGYDDKALPALQNPMWPLMAKLTARLRHRLALVCSQRGRSGWGAEGTAIPRSHPISTDRSTSLSRSSVGPL